MSFRVEPDALRTYAAQLAQAKAAAEAAQAYVEKWGTLSAHEKGLLGMVWPNHQNYVSQVTTMLQHLRDLTDASAHALARQAERYEETDADTAAGLDASYPAAPRAPLSRD